jgi:hypothetical protein
VTRRTWAALLAAFVVLASLLAVTTVTLISQRDRTDLLNRQIGSLLNETTLVVKRIAPTLEALPTQRSTVAGRANAAAGLVRSARTLIDAVPRADLLSALRASADVLQSIDQPGELASTLASVDTLATNANRAGATLGRVGLLRRVLNGLNDLGELVALQRRLLAVQVDAYFGIHRTGSLTAGALATARRTLAVATQILQVGQQTLAHASSLDHKIGPVP